MDTESYKRRLKNRLIATLFFKTNVYVYFDLGLRNGKMNLSGRMDKPSLVLAN